MAEPKDVDPSTEEEYDEVADSDFDLGEGQDELMSSLSQSEAEDDDTPKFGRPRKRQKTRKLAKRGQSLGDLDSGDEATIREQQALRKKKKQKGEVEDAEDSDGDGQSWRAKTRAMRERERDERKQNRLATTSGSAVDVDKLWENMNKPGGADLHPSMANEAESSTPNIEPRQAMGDANGGPHPRIANRLASHGPAGPKEPAPPPAEEMITIKRTYRFAGETHVEEKTVAKTSAEARLWLSQQSAPEQKSIDTDTKPLRRPLRKISRFDPNLNNLASFQKTWDKQENALGIAKGPRLNVVEKSKMDWAAHVDEEGLQEELDEHARAKEGYLGRMDFLDQVERRKEEEARLARTGK